MDNFLWTQPQDEGHSKEVPNAAIKNEEEIAKFTVDERLGEVERAVLYLNGGQAIQQKHAIANLPSLLRGRGRSAYDTVAQPLKAALNRLDLDAQIAVAEAFATIARERLLAPADLCVCLLPLIVRNINKEKSEEETEAWLGALHHMLPQLETEVLRTEVVSLALSKGEVQDSVNSRVICARILGGVAQYLSQGDIEKGFLKKAVAMCQDVEFEVRASMAAQLGLIGRAVGREMAAKFVLDELFELLNDEQAEVRVATFSSLVSLLEYLSPEARKTRVLPVLRQHMRPADLDLVLQRCIARLFGTMMKAIQADIESEDQQLFLNCYRHFAARSDSELRRLTAQQLPLVLAAATAASSNSGGAGASGGTIFSAQFTDTLNTILTDTDDDVRVVMATNFHEVACVVDKQCSMLLSRPLIRLLRDGTPAVQAALLPQLAGTLQLWSANSDAGILQDAVLSELLRSLLDVEGTLQRAWRLQKAMAQALPAIAQVFSVEQLLDLVMPMAIRFLNSPVVAVRPAAADGAIALLRSLRRDKAGRVEFFLRLVREFGRGRSFSQRLTFVELLRALCRRYSSKWYKEFAFDLSLELLFDPVPNVRISMISLMPSLKQTIKMPEDVDLLERLNTAIANAMNDNDRDISTNARACNDLYKKVPLRMGGGLSASAAAGDSSAQAVFEAEDKRKEEEEAEFPYAVEELKEIKAELAQVSRKNGMGRGAKDAAKAAPAAGAGPPGRGAAAGGGKAGAASPSGLHGKAGSASSSTTSSGIHGKAPGSGPSSPLRGAGGVTAAISSKPSMMSGSASTSSTAKLSPLPKGSVSTPTPGGVNGALGRGASAQVKLPSLGRATAGGALAPTSSAGAGAGAAAARGAAIGGVSSKSGAGSGGGMPSKLTPVPSSLLAKRGK